MNGLQISHFSTGYGKQSVINELNLSALQRGKISILLGPNGSGKSTLLRGLAGLNSAQGQVLLDGVNLVEKSLAERADKVAFLPQFLPVGARLRVLESIIVAQRALGIRYSSVDKTAIITVLQQLGIAHLALHYLDQLSGGQKQLVGLAQLLIRRPELLLLDEPLSALDPNYQFHVMQLITRETRCRHCITLVVVHDINVALRYGDYVVILKQGQLVDAGVPQEVITSACLAEVYGIKARIEHCSRGIPQMIIDDLATHGHAE